MANIIKLKKSVLATRAPTVGDLEYGELAINYNDGRLYFKKSDGVDPNNDTIQSFAASNNVTNITGGIRTPEFIDFNTSASVTPAVGRLFWDNTDGNQTLSVGMAGGNVVQQIGQETFYRIKASSAITNGQVVMFTGTLGASGALTGAPATGLTANTGIYVMGVATENIALNQWGYVTAFGLVRGIDTTGGAESWTDGTILYFDPSIPGGLTKNVPTAPNPKVVVAAVVHAASNGSVFVRVSHGSVLGGTDGNVQFGTLSDNDLIVYNGSTARWENKSASTLTGVNADQLDGQHGIYYLNYDNLSNKPITSGTTAPVSAADNSLFWDSDVASLFIRYNDGTSSQWVEAVPQLLVEGPIGTYTLSGNLVTTANLTVEGSLYETSDIRLKTNVETIDNPLQTVNSLRGVSFNWKESNRQSIGLIAQEVEAILPFLVSEEQKGTKVINYTAIIGLLIEAIKDLDKRLKNNGI